jgi:hypothetical protein
MLIASIEREIAVSGIYLRAGYSLLLAGDGAGSNGAWVWYGWEREYEDKVSTCPLAR